MVESSAASSDSGPDSLELLRRHRAGDGEALGQLIERYLPRITRIVRVRLGKFLRDRESLDDVVQNVLARVVQGLETYEHRTDAHWIDWVAKLAHHEVLNLARRERAQKRDQEPMRADAERDGPPWAGLVADQSSVVTRAARRELEELVDRALGELTEAHREVILLRDYAGMDWAPIAEMLAPRTVGACQELHRRAKRELGRRLPPP
jgi:RNA polymerase sigma-70 factor (ECF subfamily)